MNQKELNEIRRRFRLDKNNFSRIFGCYVNSNRDKAKCQLFVDVDGEVGLEAFFTVHFVAGLVVGKIGVRHVAVSEKHLVGTYEKTRKGSHEDGGFAFLSFEEQT